MHFLSGVVSKIRVSKVVISVLLEDDEAALGKLTDYRYWVQRLA